MKITDVVWKCAVESGVAEEEALKKGMEEKSREFAGKGNEISAKAWRQCGCLAYRIGRSRRR